MNTYKKSTLKTDEIVLYYGNCLDVILNLRENSVDSIITDIPYGTTQCKWDEIIPFDDLWKAIKHILKTNGTFITTSNQPFTSKLILSNTKWFRQELIWDKILPVGHLDANRKHMKRHENIIVFCGVGRYTYNPQKWKSTPYKKGLNKQSEIYGKFNQTAAVNEDGSRFPTSIISISGAKREGLHPTQKPVELYEYLVKTYTNKMETVLDLTMGSGTTGIACVNTNRKFIGIELKLDYFKIAYNRIKEALETHKT